MTYEKIVKYVEKKAAAIKTKSDVAVQVDITGEGDGVGAVGCIRCIGGPGSDVGLLSEGFCDDVDHRPLVS